MKKLLLTLAFTLAAAGAQAVPLSSLLDGGSITAGDKLFDRWTVVFQGASTGDPVDTGNIDITALIDGGLDPGPGLHFAIQNGEFNVAGDDIFAYLDFQISFRVTVLDPSLAITGSSLSDFNAFHVRTVDGSNDAGSYIREWIGTAAGLSNLGLMNVEFSVLDDVSTTKTADSASYAAQSEIWVTKNILVWARDLGDSAGIFAFDQRFVQASAVVPEPASIVLVALALLGLGLASRRRYS